MRKIRLLNVLAELCKCDPRDIEWDNSGSADMVRFSVKSGKNPVSYVLKMSRDNSGVSCDGFMDFRVRVIVQNN